jgi:23S rRNA pseudouridine2605 synthase
MTNERKVLSLRRDTSGIPQITERLHKVLANAGLGSRRSLEERIAAGEIRVNGEVVGVGASVNSGDRVELDGRRFAAMPCAPEETRVLMYHKPEGLVTSNDDPEGRATVFEKLPRLKGARWVSVGRLDINTTGLLLLTTDGELANALMHPSREVEREYVCRIFGEVTDDHLRQLKNGVQLEDGPASFDEIVEIHRDEKHAWFRVLLSEGRNREVRRLWEAMGLMVSRLKRIRYGIVELPRELRRGHHRSLDTEQIQALRHSVGLNDAPQSLTLEPVIGQRRAPVRGNNEFRPEPKQQRAWTGTNHDEARELRAFDRPLLDDTLGRRKKFGAGPGARKRGPSKPGAKPGGPRTGARPGQRPRGGAPGASAGAGAGIERGNRAGGPTSPRPAGGPQRRAARKPRVMTGPMDSNEMLFKTWYPGEGKGNTVGNTRPPGDEDSRGNTDNYRGGGGNRPPRGDDVGNRAPADNPRDGNRMPVEGNRAPAPGAQPAGARRGAPQRPGGAGRPRGPGSPGRGAPRGDDPNRALNPRNARGPRTPRDENTASRAPDAPAPADGEGRQRRGPFGRVRKRPGKPQDGGGTPPSPPAAD